MDTDRKSAPVKEFRLEETCMEHDSISLLLNVNIPLMVCIEDRKATSFSSSRDLVRFLFVPSLADYAYKVAT